MLMGAHGHALFCTHLWTPACHGGNMAVSMSPSSLVNLGSVPPSCPEHLRDKRLSPENNMEKWEVRSLWERFSGRQGYRSPHDEKMKKDGAPYMILIWPISNGGRSLHPPQILSEFWGEQSVCVCVCVWWREQEKRGEQERVKGQEECLE